MHSNGSCLGLTLRRRKPSLESRAGWLLRPGCSNAWRSGRGAFARRPVSRPAPSVAERGFGDEPARLVFLCQLEKRRQARSGQGGAGGAAPLLHGALCRGLIPDETLESPWRELPGRRRCTLSTGTSARSRGLPAAAGLMRFRPVASGAGAQAFAGPLVGPPEVGHAAAPPHGHHPANFLLPHVTPGFEVRSGLGPAEEERGAVILLRRVLG